VADFGSPSDAELVAAARAGNGEHGGLRLPGRAASAHGRGPGPAAAYQLATNLLTAAGSRPVEVRITRLVEGVFYAVVVVEAPGGVAEVDARPSDALNLAVLSGAPIRVDAAVLSDPEIDRHAEWEQYPARVPDLAAEERQRRADLLARLAEEHERRAPREP
jgi:bifunctional DNase/RNase